MVSEKKRKKEKNEIQTSDAFSFVKCSFSFSSSICIPQHYINEMINLKNKIIGMRMRYEIKWKWKWTWHHFHVYFYLCFFMFLSLFQSWTSSYFRDRSFGRNGWCSQFPLPIILSLSKRKHNVIPVVIRLCVFIKSNQMKQMNEWMMENVMKSFDTQNDISSFIIIHHSEEEESIKIRLISIKWYQSTKWNCEQLGVLEQWKDELYHNW